MDTDTDCFEDDEDFFLSQINMDFPLEQNSPVNRQPSNDGSSNNDAKNNMIENVNKRTSDLSSRKRLADKHLDMEAKSILGNPKKPLLLAGDEFVTNSINSCIRTPVKKSKRQFPGPAGILPTLKPTEIKLLDKSRLVSKQITDIINEEATVCNFSITSPSSSSQASNSTLASTASTDSQDNCLSQNDRALFERPTWNDILEHLNLSSNYSNNSSMLNQLNIRWIRKNISWLPTAIKIPFLLLTLQEAPDMNGSTRQFKTPCVRCIDPTGSIEAALDYKFVSNYTNDLIPGTCLALQNVGLLRLRKQEVMITITERTLICMASSVNEDNSSKAVNNSAMCQFDNSKADSHQSVTTSELGVKITTFANFLPQQIKSNYEKLVSLKENLAMENNDSRRDFPTSSRNFQIRPVSAKMSEYFSPGYSTSTNQTPRADNSTNNDSSYNLQNVENLPTPDPFAEDEDDPFWQELDVDLLDESMAF